jgi:hypothetical protein
MSHSTALRVGLPWSRLGIAGVAVLETNLIAFWIGNSGGASWDVGQRYLVSAPIVAGATIAAWVIALRAWSSK